MGFSPLQLILFLFLLVFLLVLVQLGVLTIAFEKLGLSGHSAFLLLFASLFGSGINLPLFSIHSQRPPEETIPPLFRGLLHRGVYQFTGKTIIAINVGGCVIPVAFSIYLLSHNPLGLVQVVVAIGIVAAICRVVSRPIPGLGIGMPIFMAPIAAALTAILISPEQSAPLAYICGTLGVLIGADLLRLNDIRRIGAPVASIGGAGTFDGIFITGVVAVLLA